MQIILTSRPRDLTRPWVREGFHYNVEKSFTYDYSLFGLYNFLKKTNALGSTYHDTEYCEDYDFRMKSFCGMTIHKKTLYLVNTELG